MKAQIIKDELLGEIEVVEVTNTITEQYNTVDFDVRDIMSIVELYAFEKHGIIAETVSLRNGVITIKW
jgi:hypothetical protein